MPIRALVSQLRRQILWLFVLIAAAAIIEALVFTFYSRTVFLVWFCSALVPLLVLLAGFLLSRSISSSLQDLFSAIERVSPGSVEKLLRQPNKIAALAQAVHGIASDLETKEQTWMGDLEQRSQVVQQLSRTLQEQAVGFETALNSVDMAVCLFDSSGNLVQVNQKFCELTAKEAEKLKAMGLLAIVAELQKLVADPKELMSIAEQIYRTPTVANSADLALRDRHGNLRIYCTPIFGKLSSLVGIVISPEETADATVVDQLKTEFISTVSHELRTPLTAIRGALGLVLGGAGGPLTEPIRELLTIANNNADRLIQLVNDILEVFRLDTGKLQLQTEPADIGELISDAWIRVQGSAITQNIQLDTRIAPQTPPVLVDCEQVGIVLEKLLSNAIKFSTTGSIVRVGAEPMQGNPDSMVLWVQDFGAGIPLEAQERIFGKFQQAEEVMTRQHQGSGLGLAICRGIVESHGGRIWVKSEAGKGSTFFITLPVAPEAAQKRKMAAANVSANDDQRDRCLVMVIEDDSDTRSVITRMLERGGHFVIALEKGAEATALALRHHPEVIALDMVLPDISGLEVLRTLKGNEQTRRIPVICVSISDDLASQALQLGALQYLRKPVEGATLLNAVQSAYSAGLTSGIQAADPPLAGGRV